MGYYYNEKTNNLYLIPGLFARNFLVTEVIERSKACAIIDTSSLQNCKRPHEFYSESINALLKKPEAVKLIQGLILKINADNLAGDRNKIYSEKAIEFDANYLSSVCNTETTIIKTKLEEELKLVFELELADIKKELEELKLVFELELADIKKELTDLKENIKKQTLENVDKFNCIDNEIEELGDGFENDFEEYKIDVDDKFDKLEKDFEEYKKDIKDKSTCLENKKEELDSDSKTDTKEDDDFIIENGYEDVF